MSPIQSLSLKLKFIPDSAEKHFKLINCSAQSGKGSKSHVFSISQF